MNGGSACSRVRTCRRGTAPAGTPSDPQGWPDIADRFRAARIFGETASAAGAFVTRDVGAGVTVDVSGLTLGGAQAADYTLTQPTATANTGYSSLSRAV